MFGAGLGVAADERDQLAAWSAVCGKGCQRAWDGDAHLALGWGLLADEPGRACASAWAAMRSISSAPASASTSRTECRGHPPDGLGTWSWVRAYRVIALATAIDADASR